MMQKAKSLTLKATMMTGQPITDRSHFAMVELLALEGLGDLISRAPKAAQLAVALIRRMQPGSSGVVVCSRETMRELLGCSMPTVERALRLLIEEGWVQRIRIGGAHALAINHRVAWIGPRGDIQHAVFGATVIASRSEQDALALNPPPMKNLPILQPGEDALPFGEGIDPPSQKVLDGMHATASINPETGEIHNYQQELEQRGQQCLDLPIDAPKCGGGDGVKYTQCDAPKLRPVRMGQTYSDSVCQNCGGYVRHSWD